MINTVHKIFFVWQLEKEEAWLNDMASHGYSLTHASKFGTYDFEESQTDKYTYKILFLKGSFNSAENIKYLKFLEEMGISAVCHYGYPFTSCVYVRGLAEDYPDGIDLFSDIDSKINYIKIMAFYLLFVLCLLIVATVLNFIAGVNTEYINPLNVIEGSITLGLGIATTIAMIKEFVQIGKLKKEREIHE